MNSSKRIPRQVFNINSIVGLRFISGPKRKYPINSNHWKDVPVHEFKQSKSVYRRLFAWGNAQTGALGIKGLLEKDVTCIRGPKRSSLGEKFEVVTATAGFGFSVIAVNSDNNVKLYGTGVNTDSQIGYHAIREGHPMEIIFYPQPISLPFRNPNEAKILKLSAGRAHLMVLTNEGIFLLGNNAYGQCGRKIISNENYSKSNLINYIDKIDGNQIVDIECGQDHSMLITEEGSVYSCGWGADGQTGLGHFNNCSRFTKVKGDIDKEKITKLACRADFVLALNDKGEVFGWGNIEYGQMSLPSGDQQLATPTSINMLNKLGKIQSIASAGPFCLVATDRGEVFSWGYGVLGLGPNVDLSNKPLKIPEVLFGRNDFQPESKVIDLVCGVNYAAAITNLGDMFIWGRNKSGCLGLGDDKNQYFPLKVSIGGSVEKVFCGFDHTLAICKPFI
ncbi:RCC1-like G exchanging factor-like protein [Euwallacea fornicatus]|uniref:RCC1-like G exchanging factor-like protein n=1 Tax=Euwallacea fornicatus TaxID=995702 RepID=UPI00338D87B8